MLEVKNVNKIFNPKTANEHLALDNFSLTLNSGDFLTVVGGNGSGKSTLLNCVAGVFGVDSGEIFIDGEEVTRLPEHRRAKYIGRVFQDPMMGTAARMSIEENLALAQRRGQWRTLRRGVSAGEHSYFREVLAQLDLGLEDRMDTNVGLLSGGQRQALTLVMATLQKPKLLLLDEHTAALDPKTAAKVLALSDMLVARDKLTTLMVTHNMKDAIRHGDRLIMMEAGKVVFEAEGETKRQLTSREMVERFTAASGLEN